MRFKRSNMMLKTGGLLFGTLPLFFVIFGCNGIKNNIQEKKKYFIKDMIKTSEASYIDRTEVTKKQYNAWLATNPTTNDTPEYCSWNDDYMPSCEWPPEEINNQQPVVCIDWCDAYAYCKSMGKRLCGNVKGVESDYSAFSSPSSQWYKTCIKGTPENDGIICNGWKSGTRKAADVTTFQSCKTSNDVYDLIGNVWEWEDSCEVTSGARDKCRLRGGSFMSADRYLSCNIDGGDSRDARSSDYGFRCCFP